MSRKPLTARCCLYITLAFTLIGTVLRTVAMFTDYDREVGYFDASVCVTLLTVISFAAVLFPLALAFATPKDVLPKVWPEPKRNAIAAVPFVLTGTGAAWQIWIWTVEKASNTLLLLSAVTALLSALYYFTTITVPRSVVVPLAGYSPILWALLSVAETYTDQFTTMNSPIKLALQFGCLGVALLTTAELRFRLNKAAPRAALFIHCIASFLCLTGSIPTLIALAVGILDRPIHGAYALSLLGIGVYALCRLVFYTVVSPSPILSEAEGTNNEDFETEPHTTDSDHIIGE